MRLLFLKLNWKEVNVLIRLLDYLELYNFEDVPLNDIQYLRSAAIKLKESVHVV